MRSIDVLGQKLWVVHMVILPGAEHRTFGGRGQLRGVGGTQQPTHALLTPKLTHPNKVPLRTVCV